MFSGRTPESLIPRSDSRNPATTCKGITKSGRPCRRSIDSKADNGVLAVVSVVGDSDEEETGAAAYFCWQHKDQAEHLMTADTAAPGKQDTQLYPLKEKSSIDTLVARLGVLDIDEPLQSQTEASRRRRQSRQHGAGYRPHNRINRPSTWDRVQGPLMSVPSDLMAEQKHLKQRATAQPQRKKRSLCASLCCGEVDDDYVEIVRHTKRVSDQQLAITTNHDVHRSLKLQAPQPVFQNRSKGTSSVLESASAPRPQRSSLPSHQPLADKNTRPLNNATSRPSDTSIALSYIPKTLSPQLTSTLLTEMSKPISQSDEHGYIYIFWLTPESLGSAPSSTASTLLAPPSRPEQSRRTSDVLRQYSVKHKGSRPNTARQHSHSATSNTSEKSTILLKIGRANNVTRRMNEWTRQCGYSLSLVRYYPYVPSTPTPSPSPSPNASPANSRHQSYNNQGPSDPDRRRSGAARKVPHAHRVERLIHLELGLKRVTRKCDACGREHREWFEVEASKDGVKGVDEVVKRWVDWAERSSGLSV